MGNDMEITIQGLGCKVITEQQIEKTMATPMETTIQSLVFRVMMENQTKKKAEMRWVLLFSV